MKKITIVFWTIIIAIFTIIMVGCEKNDMIYNEDSTGIENKDVYLKNGRLVFKNNDVFYKLKQEISNMPNNEYLDWTKNMEFNSFENSFDVLHKQVEELLEQDKDQAADRLYESKYDFPPSINRTINKDGVLQIADKIYIYKNKQKYEIKETDENHLNSIIENIESSDVSESNSNIKVTKIEKRRIFSKELSNLKGGHKRKNYQFPFHAGSHDYKFVFECDYYYDLTNSDNDAVVVRNKFEYYRTRKWRKNKWMSAGEKWRKKANLSVSMKLTNGGSQIRWFDTYGINYDEYGSGDKHEERQPAYPNQWAWIIGVEIGGSMEASTDNEGSWSLHEASYSDSEMFFWEL